MTKDRQLPKSQKSHRPGHERFKDLYAKEHAATTPELANRAPRQVAQSVTPNTSDGTTTNTANSNGRTGGEHTPATGKTPLKKKGPKRSKKATKWSHVPSASDGDATHFENFENDGGAQMAVAKMKTRKLQWSRETIDTDDAVDETDAGESFRDEIGGSAGGGYTKDSGSAGELVPQLPPLERTQEDDKWRDEVKKDLAVDEPDAKNEKKLLSPTPSPPKKEGGGGGSKEALKEGTTKEAAGKTVKEAKTQAPTARSPQKPAKEKSPTKPKEAPKTTAAPPPKQQENTKREQKAVPKLPEKSKVEKRKATTPKKEVTTREKAKPAVPAAPPPAPAKVPAPAPAPTQSPAPVPVAAPAAKRPPSESTTDATKSTVETKREAKQAQHPQTGVGVTRSKEPSSANYRLAVKLMKILKRNNYLENALRFEEGERVRKHFEANGFAAQPPAPILALLNQALNFALETVLFRADDLDTQITNDLRVFIIKKNEARLAMLEVCFNRPDLMPNKWGGARKDVKRSKSSTKTREGGKRGWFASLFGRGEK